MISRPVSLKTRVTLAGVAVMALLVVALDVFVYFNLRNGLLGNLDKVLQARAQLAGELGRELTPPELDQRLGDAGIQAIVRTADGTVVGGASARGVATSFDTIPPGQVSSEGEQLVGRTVRLPDDATVMVLASRGGVDATLRRLLVIEVVGSAAAIVLAFAVLHRLSTVVLRPVKHVASTARRIATGGTGERLRERSRDTDLADMATAFNDMLDALEAALADARVSEERSRRFLADAAHQLRTPAASIRATVGSLLRTRDEATRERLLDNLAGESRRMSKLLSSLLRIARLDQSGPPPVEHVDLVPLVTRLVDRHRPLAPSLEFRIVVRDGDRCDVHADPAGVEEAVSNLLDNAARHARTRVDVEVGRDGRAGATGVMGATSGAGATIVVSDDGPGVAPEQRDRVFERFVSLSGSGSGLGLPIARAIATQHGGSLEYHAPGFVLRLGPSDAPHRP